MTIICERFAPAEKVRIPPFLTDPASARKGGPEYDKGDAKAIASLWTEDADYLNGQLSVNGRPAIQQLYEEFLQAHPGSKMEIRIDSIRTLAPTVAIEQGTATVSGSSADAPSTSAYTAIHVKQDGKWRMASVRESEPLSPRDGADLQGLSWLVGHWVAKGDGAEVEMRCDWLANKSSLGIKTSVTSSEKTENTQKGGTQVIGHDPVTGELVCWFSGADGGQGFGVWTKDGDRWVLRTRGTMADGTTTSATNVLEHASDDVFSWQSLNRVVGGRSIPDTSEIVLERVHKSDQATP